MAWIHYAVVGFLVVGGLAYVLLKPQTLNPVADAGAAEAMALVQTHRARNAPTLLQALTQRVQVLTERGQGVRMGSWTVESQKGKARSYLVKVFIRDQGSTGQWFQRDYEWQVDLDRKVVVPLSMPAEDLMPSGEAGPLIRGDSPVR